MRADSLSVWLGRAMLAIFLVVCAAALALGVTQERAYTQAFLLGLVWVAAALWLLRPLCREGVIAQAWPEKQPNGRVLHHPLDAVGLVVMRDVLHL